MKILEADKIGSATSPLKLTKTVSVIDENDQPRAGDVVVKALSESVTYGNLELPNGRLAKINRGDVLLGVSGKRRALKGFVGDGIVGGYAVDSVLKGAEIESAISSFVFCAGDYVGVIGGIAVLRNLGIEIDVADSVTDSQMGEDFVEKEYGLKAGNARRDGARLFELIPNRMDGINRIFESDFYPEYPVHPVNITR